MMTSGCTESMCVWLVVREWRLLWLGAGVAGGDADGDGGRYEGDVGCCAKDASAASVMRGQLDRHRLANFLESSESRMHTARAIESIERSHRVSSAWTRGTEGVARGDAEAGTKLARWIAGPKNL
jgi:hypothetical protein